MRRGHPGLGGWRGDNPRHFRPRSGDSPHFRPPRIYPLLDTPRFPPPGSGGRLNRGPRPYNAHPRHVNDHGPQDYHGRNNYRDVNHQTTSRIHERSHHPPPRSILPLIQTRQKNNDHSGFYQEPPIFYDDVQTECHVNNLGDIDHRQLNIPHNDSYGHQKHPISPWSNPPPLLENKKHYYENRSSHKSYHHHEPNDNNTIPVLEYGGHRPPSSDHYGGNLGSMVDNNNSFSRSVDDTVDIVRRRLMNRNDSQQSSEDVGGQSSNDQEVSESLSQHTQEEPPTKKRIQRQQHNAKSNCDKMKSKIVHQLFKMDKDKMHKLMDNPSSSTKFEYAISSLITESQNSLNRHLRSVAEKSLYTSSTDFIHNDNNTIYEDTFMKQMQCLLDPQDTVLLEDIKPIVMAELSKVLQLEDFEHRFDGSDNQGSNYPREDQSNNPYYEPYNCEEYPQERFYDQDQVSVSNYDDQDTIKTAEDNSNYEHNQEPVHIESKPLFERRPVRTNDHNLERRQSMDIQRQRRSIDNLSEDKFRVEEPVPLFDGNAEQFSEDEDPFAELDNQYHVAVDHNFITIDDISCDKNEIIDKIDSDFMAIKQQIESQIQSIAKSPLKLLSKSSIGDNAKQQDRQVKFSDVAKEISTPINPSHHDVKLEQTDQRQEHATQPKETDKSENSTNAKSAAPSHTRKRSIDQRPSHRKEKRKKSESSQAETNKHVSSKDTTNNASDTKSLNVDTLIVLAPKNDSGKEVLNDNKKIESADKGYSDKYVKRKETPKKSKESEANKKRSSSSSSHSNVSPRDNNTSITSQTPTKTDPKIKLKPIDMFGEQSKKVTVYHSHRNTAVAPTASETKVEVSTIKVQPPQPVVITRKPIKAFRRSVSVQVIKKLVTKGTQTFESKCVSTRFSQTEKKRLVSKIVQTDHVSFAKSTSKSNDAFERMKEIDLEIQVLLQEKFKLYSSLESKETCSSSMPTLGMTVLNVTPYDESKEDNVDDCDMSADDIVDEFTNIPVEELEQIAFESVEGVQNVSPKLGKRSVVQKLQRERKKSESPSTRRNKKAKTPNISLLEQIITDDRPLEDIISLDDLEKPPAKSKKRPPKSKLKKKVTKKTKAVKYNIPSGYELKECTVVLMRADISHYWNKHPLKVAKDRNPLEPILVLSDPETEDVSPPTAEHLSDAPVEIPPDCPLDTSQEQKPKVEHQEEIVEDSVGNDLQFDMLDVSEDIVIGDSCELKCTDKGHERVTISEEIILDNSQSSCDDAFTDPGQIENVCKTYDYSTDENLRRDSVTVSGHADAVLAIECLENDFIAACLDGNVYHFSGDGQLLNTLRGSNLAVTCLTIVKEKYETIVYTGSLDSRIRYYDLETGLEKGPECNVLSPIQTMDRAWDTIFVGTRTGFVLQFECKNNMLIPVSTVKFSEQSILALRALKEGPRKVLLVAARSENVTVKDAQTGLLLRTLEGPKMTVYTLLFEDGKVYCGTSSHQIHVFDYSSGAHTACHEGGKGAVCLRATGGLVFAGCYDGCVYVYREAEPRPLAQLRGPSLMLLSLAVLGTKIIAGYKDRSLYIWKIPLNILQEMIL